MTTNDKLSSKEQITQVQVANIKTYLQNLQAQICSKLEAHEQEGGVDGSTNNKFISDEWDRIKNGLNKGGGCSRVLADGEVIEKGGVMFSHIFIDELPASASKRYPQLEGAKAEAMGVSLVIHPKNPNVPTSHMNVRFFVAYPEDETAQPIWWFGGGFDLTPFYIDTSDCVAWHQKAFDLCQPFGEEVYANYKQWCDNYFYIKHRDEQRGIGGLFFDDLNSSTSSDTEDNWTFERCFAFMQAVGNGYLDAILPLFDKYKHKPYSQEQRDFQLYRRGRYVEFNLIYDRGTLFGLQSGGRIESILVSLPNIVGWHYNKTFTEDSQEHKLTAYYLQKRDWLNTLKT